MKLPSVIAWKLWISIVSCNSVLPRNKAL